MVSLQVVDETSFPDFLERRIQRRAEAQVKSGQSCLSEARAESREVCQEQFPNGVKSKNDALFVIVDKKFGKPVGEVWLKENHSIPRSSMAIQELLIYEAFRRKGYGHQVLTDLEKISKQKGIASILTWMKPENLAAQALCNKTGFKTVGEFMRKTVSAPGPIGTVSLKPITRSDLEVFINAQIQRHTETKSKNDPCSREEALCATTKEYHEMFPQGLPAEHNHVLTINDDECNLMVGTFWISMHREGARLTAFIEDFRIYDAFHRKGYGTQALIALEQAVHLMGAEVLSLFVLAHNRVAQKLYLKSGFVVTGIEASKRVGIGLFR